jgi:hypothetical protein
VKRLVIALMLMAVPLLAGEGMWMPQQIPQVAQPMRAAGVQMDPNKFADLTGDPMGAVISLGGCTASFVSVDGLVVTNHHCGFGALQFNSNPQRDLITNGFLARTREEELPAGPTQRIFATTKIEDVTARVTGGLAEKLSDRDRQKMITRRQKELVAECEKPGGLRCRVAGFFEGSQYLRTTQMEIRDVRLVYAPANSVGDFGGDIDNFEWPRHTGDWSFLRAYVGPDGKPAPYAKSNVPYHPAHWLKVSSAGVNEGDAVIVAGYPGRTFRYRTVDEVRDFAEFVYPTSIRYYTALIKILENASRGNRDIQIKNASRIKGNNNSLKNYQSVYEGFTKDRIVDARLRREADLRAFAAKAPDGAKFTQALEQIAKLNEQLRATRERDQLLTWLLGTKLEGYVARSSPMLSQSANIYRSSLERVKPDLERSAGFMERDLPRLKDSSDRAQRTIEPSSDRAGLRFFLLEATRLPSSERIKAIDDALAATGEKTPEGQVDRFLDQLCANTKVADQGERARMLGETGAQLKARNDAMINLAASLMPGVLENEARNEAIDGAMSRYRPTYFEALRQMGGGALYPDANGTLRITFGKVEGYTPKDATWYTPQTSIKGILQKDTGVEPFNSPAKLLAAARDAQKMAPYVDAQLHAVPVDFLSSCDTTGGNSGSPTLNGKGELCGLLFDGNYESIDADFLFNPDMTRSIHVDAVYMLWVMDAVDGAHNLMHEMGLPAHFE